MFKLSENGELLWSKLYGGTCFEEAISLEHASQSGFVIAGGACSDDGDIHWNKGIYDGWVFRIDDEGVLLWERTFGGGENDYFYHIGRRRNGDFVLAGMSESVNGELDVNKGNG